MRLKLQEHIKHAASNQNASDDITLYIASWNKSNILADTQHYFKHSPILAKDQF
jgi:beta-xylosidase